jgi:hypothetical protein
VAAGFVVVAGALDGDAGEELGCCRGVGRVAGVVRESAWRVGGVG